MTLAQWKFSKLRPANFPTVRLAQLAGVIHLNPALFSTLTSSEGMNNFHRHIQFEEGEYWKKHYDFGKEKAKKSTLGKSSKDVLIINTLAPLLFAYADYLDKQELKEKAVNLLESLPAEYNRIVKKWANIAIPNSAFESQGLIQVYKKYCIDKRCLQCKVGVQILSK